MVIRSYSVDMVIRSYGVDMVIRSYGVDMVIRSYGDKVIWCRYGDKVIWCRYTTQRMCYPVILKCYIPHITNIDVTWGSRAGEYIVSLLFYFDDLSLFAQHVLITDQLWLITI